VDQRPLGVPNDFDYIYNSMTPSIRVFGTAKRPGRQGGSPMTSDLFADTWKRVHGSVKDWWSTFIHDDLPPIPQRNHDRLALFMRERYGYTSEQAEGEIARRFSA
jgi:hypothetical protein